MEIKVVDKGRTFTGDDIFNLNIRDKQAVYYDDERSRIGAPLFEHCDVYIKLKGKWLLINKKIRDEEEEKESKGGE